jgi:hypothetical protein
MLQKREQTPKCGSNEEEKKYLGNANLQSNNQIQFILIFVYFYILVLTL